MGIVMNLIKPVEKKSIESSVKADPADRHGSRRYSFAEELANSVTHGIGAVLSVAALAVLLLLACKSGDVWHMVGFGVYGVCLLMLYLSSALYHAVSGSRLKTLFRRLDHASIFLLIAGTYTPVLLIAMRGPWGWSLLALIWAMAAAGLIYELIYLGRHKFVSLTIYLAMGWLAIVAIKPMIAILPHGLLYWVVFGGLVYTGGVVFYVSKCLPFNHAIWHLFVLGGSTLHFIGILIHLTPLS
jgi:hemolysin III